MPWEDFIFSPDLPYIHALLSQCFSVLSPTCPNRTLSIYIIMAFKFVSSSPFPLLLPPFRPSSLLFWIECPFSGPPVPRFTFQIHSWCSNQSDLPKLILDHVTRLLKHLQWLSIAYWINLKLSGVVYVIWAWAYFHSLLLNLCSINTLILWFLDRTHCFNFGCSVHPLAPASPGLLSLTLEDMVWAPALPGSLPGMFWVILSTPMLSQTWWEISKVHLSYNNSTINSPEKRKGQKDTTKAHHLNNVSDPGHHLTQWADTVLQWFVST